MKNLVGMAIFASVVDARSFSEAARRLGLSKSMVSKEITKLEKSLRARLLNRTTRSLSVTEIGAAYYDHCARVVQEANEAEAAGRQASHRASRRTQADRRRLRDAGDRIGAAGVSRAIPSDTDRSHDQ